MRITGVEKLTDEKWINLYAATFEHRGHHGRWVFATRKPSAHTGLSNDAVIIVAILRNPGEAPRLVLIREYRVPVGDYVIGLPAGLVEEGEPIEEAIRRELHEETGLTLSRVLRITQPLLSSSGMSDEAAAMAFVEVTGQPSSEHLESSEDIEVILLDSAEISRACADQSLIIDAKAWTVLAMYQHTGLV